jgi:hypothetical protein
MPPERTSKLLKKPSARKRERSSTSKHEFLNFFFSGSLCTCRGTASGPAGTSQAVSVSVVSPCLRLVFHLSPSRLERPGPLGVFGIVSLTFRHSDIPRIFLTRYLVPAIDFCPRGFLFYLVLYDRQAPDIVSTTRKLANYSFLFILMTLFPLLTGQGVSGQEAGLGQDIQRLSAALSGVAFLPQAGPLVLSR